MSNVCNKRVLIDRFHRLHLISLQYSFHRLFKKKFPRENIYSEIFLVKYIKIMKQKSKNNETQPIFPK